MKVVAPMFLWLWRVAVLICLIGILYVGTQILNHFPPNVKEMRLANEARTDVAMKIVQDKMLCGLTATVTIPRPVEVMGIDRDVSDDINRPISVRVVW